MNHSMEGSLQIGNHFTNSCPDWQEGTYENFKEWALKQFGAKDFDSDYNTKVPVNFLKVKDIEFKKNKAGVLVLPPIHDFNTTRKRQRVVCGYIGAVYCVYIQLIMFLIP